MNLQGGPLPTHVPQTALSAVSPAYAKASAGRPTAESAGLSPLHTMRVGQPAKQQVRQPAIRGTADSLVCRLADCPVGRPLPLAHEAGWATREAAGSATCGTGDGDVDPRKPTLRDDYQAG